MYKPIFVLAGQSNAMTIADSIKDALIEQYGIDGFVLIESFASGAPLTYSKAGSDWLTQNELPDDLIQKTISALTSNPASAVEGFIWVQGEADAYDFAPVDSYSDQFEALFQGYESAVDEAFPDRYTGISDAKVVISSLSDHANPSTTQNLWDDVRQEHFELARQDDDVSVVNPDEVAAAIGSDASEMFRDNLHYSTRFSSALAEELIRVVSEDVPVPISNSSGPQTFYGGTGNDKYFIDHQADKIVGAFDGGHDTVHSSVTFSLRDHSQSLEDLTLTGSRDVNGTGNGRDNVINGNSGDNLLDGAWGDDTIYGGTGQDTLVGGPGDDVFFVNSPGDRVVEAWGSGHDHVKTVNSFSLRDHSQSLEDLTLTGSRDVNGTGNGRDNVINGNSGDNSLDGAWGDDTIYGGTGQDTLVGGPGDDWMNGGLQADIFQFDENSGNDVIAQFAYGEDAISLTDANFNEGDPQGNFTTRSDFLAANGSIDGDDLFLELGDGRSIRILDIVDTKGIGDKAEDYEEILEMI